MSTIQVNGEHYPAVIVEKSSESLNGRVEAPLILSFPHSGEKYPDDFDTNPELSFNVLDFPNDKYVNELYQERNNLNLTSIHANFPRTYIDVNRHQHNIDVNMIKKGENWYGRIHPTGAETGTTLFWSKTKEVFEIYSHKLSHDELKQRLAKCFVPYHQLMTYHIQKIHQDHGKAFVLDCHSMTQFDGKKRGRKERPQIDIGNRNGQSCSSEYSECVSDTFSSLGYDVKVNGRFLGGEIILRYGWPEINQHILQVEIRRDLYMDEDTRDRNERFTKMQKDCGAALKEIKNFVKQKTS
jgi:N-formylglutamate deformylase